MPSTRRAVCVAVAAALAGCTGSPSDAASPTPTDGTTLSPTPTDAPTPTDVPTPEPVGTGPNPTDVEVVNGEEVDRTVHLSVTGEAPAYDDSFTLPPGERATVDVDFPDAGTYVVRAEVDDGRSASYEWEIADPDPDGWLHLRIESDESLEFAYAIA